MQITKDTVVTLQYKVTDDKGAVLDAGKEPQAYLHGGYGNILPAIEAALEGKEAGFATTLQRRQQVDSLDSGDEHFPIGSPAIQRNGGAVNAPCLRAVEWTPIVYGFAEDIKHSAKQGFAYWRSQH